MARISQLKPRRRLRGEGTIYPVSRTTTRNGVTKNRKMWRAVLSVGFTGENGRWTRKRKYFTATTATRARAARDAYLTSVGKASPAPVETPTIEEYAEHFLENAEGRTRATTRRSYDQVLKLHVKPYIGAVKLSDLTREQILAVYDRVKNRVSPSMAARVHVTLRAMLNLALEERALSASPVALIRRAAPRCKRPRVEALSKTQADAVLRAAQGHRLEALFVLALTTGMRQGELFALRWSDVDLSKRILSVVRSAQEVNGDVTFVDPKTESSRRRIELSAVAIGALNQRRAIATQERRRSELIFPSERGYPLRKSNFIRKVWDPIRNVAGVKGLRFHILRHTAASLLLAENVHPKIVSEMLGHSSIRVTLDLYSHLIPTLQGTAAQAFDRLFLD